MGGGGGVTWKLMKKWRKMEKKIVKNYFNSPLNFINAIAIALIASSRLAYALIAAMAIIWIYGLSVLITNSAKRFFPKIFNNILSVFLFALLGSIFYLLVFLFNPFLAEELVLLILLVPILCFSSGICLRCEDDPLDEALYKAIYETLILGVFIIMLSLIREPLGYASLSVPGSDYAVYELFSFDPIFPIPIHIISSAAGALLLLGYIFVVIRMMGTPRGLKK
jgi:Na+-transporting NADH:ubiquinone oxidoreductase subunit NqrD